MAETKTLYFDESGYTGADLLNPDQPFFCVVSSDLEDGTAKGILKRSFPRYRGAEFKFTNIWRKPTNRAGISTFVKELSKYHVNVFAHVDDKRFVALTKIVDFLIEPSVTASGYDFYAEGFSRKYANMFHFALIKFGNKNLYQNLVSEYVSFVREPLETNLCRLQVTLHEMVRDCRDELIPFLEACTLGADNFHHYHNISTFGDTNEIQLTVVLSSLSYWRTKSDLDFSIIHDESSNFFKQKDIWEKITSPDVPEQAIPDSHGNPVQYPLRVISTEPGDSKKHWTIQLCDMVAGLLLRMFTLKNTQEKQDIANQLISDGLGKISIAGIRPGNEFVEGPPQLSSGPDSVDQFTSIIFQK